MLTLSSSLHLLGIGSKTADSIRSWLGDPNNKALLKRLEASGVTCVRERLASATQGPSSQSEAVLKPAPLHSETSTQSSPVPASEEPSPSTDLSLVSAATSSRAERHGSSPWVRVMGPPLHGLENTTLLVTGKLVSRGLTREEFRDLVVASGGELAEGWSARVKLVVSGEKPGENKIKKALKF